MNRIKIWVFGVGLLALAACTTNSMQMENPLSAKPLPYYQWLMSASAQERSVWQLRVEQQLTQTCALQAIVQLALMQSAYSTRKEDDDKALATLETIDSCPSARADAGDYRIFAELWKTMLIQRAQLRASGLQVKELEAQRQALSEQIEALTSIEEELNRRDPNL